MARCRTGCSAGDATILKDELNCTMVRCSHYPQATAFLDACDELGVMVWEEIPGWDHVGDATWRSRALREVHDMVVRDRNHPSVIVWGTRVNETLGQLPLYERTDLMAARLDPSRPCTGAVAGERGYTAPLYPGSAVFSFNDYSPLPAPALPRRCGRRGPACRTWSARRSGPGRARALPED